MELKIDTNMVQVSLSVVGHSHPHIMLLPQITIITKPGHLFDYGDPVIAHYQ